MPKNRRAGSVAKEHASIAILPISDGRQLVRADHQHGIVRSRGNELLRDFDSNKESSARSGNIQASRIPGTDLFLNETGGRRKNHIGCRSSH